MRAQNNRQGFDEDQWEVSLRIATIPLCAAFSSHGLPVQTPSVRCWSLLASWRSLTMSSYLALTACLEWSLSTNCREIDIHGLAAKQQTHRIGIPAQAGHMQRRVATYVSTFHRRLGHCQ